MSADIGHLPIPQFHRSCAAALGTAQNLVQQGRIDKIVVLGETLEGSLMFVSAGEDAQLTYAEALWLLERAKVLMLHPDEFDRVG